ncbi:unnamed protein product [Diamesa serratosioi]
MTSFRALMILVLVAGFATALRDGHYEDSEVVILTKDNFDHRVVQSDYAWLVLFYDNFCGHCQDFAPEYKKLAEKLAGRVEIGSLECGNSNRPLKDYYGVTRFPTMKLLWAKQPIDIYGATSDEIIINLKKYIEF